MVWDHTQTECGKRVACWSGFSYRVYINSNHYDSWIMVCGRQHIDNLMALIMVYKGIAMLNYLLATLA
jgi:hypothetical protein